MGLDTTTLAASNVPLVDSYHKLMDPFLNTAFGKLIVNICAAAAVLLAVALIIGGIFRAMGKHNSLVQMTCASAGRIVLIICVIFILAGPTVTLPLLMKVIEWAATAFGNGASDFIQ